MKLQRFYVASPITMSTKPVTIPSLELLNQLKRVLRFSPGDHVMLFNNTNKQYTASILEYMKDGVSFSILSEENNDIKPDREIWLYASLVKKSNFEWIVEKATELGVSHIVPVLSERSEKKDLNMERLEKISIEASEQSGRSTIPIIHPIMKLKESLEFLKNKGIESIAFHTEGDRFKKEELHKVKAVAAFIGPEGGWSPEEIALFHTNKIPVCNLGPQILRAETAAVAVLSQLAF